MHVKNRFHCDICNHTYDMANKSKRLRFNKHIKKLK